MAKKRGPKAHPIRDLWIYLTVRDLLQSVDKSKRRGIKSKQDALSSAAELLGIYLSIPHLWTSYTKGEKLYKKWPRDWKLPVERPQRSKREMGRPKTADVLQDYINYDLVCGALEKGHSLRESYRIARKSGCAMSRNKRGVHTASIGAIRASYEKMKRLLAQKISR